MLKAINSIMAIAAIGALTACAGTGPTQDTTARNGSWIQTIVTACEENHHSLMVNGQFAKLHRGKSTGDARIHLGMNQYWWNGKNGELLRGSVHVRQNDVVVLINGCQS